MNNYLKIILFILSFLSSNFFWGQTDVITTYNNERILCKIVKEDSVRVYFKLDGKLSAVEASLLRAEIKSIEYSYNNSGSKKLPKKNNLIKNEAKNFVAINFGLAMPTGEFAYVDIDNDKSGFAKMGRSYGLGFTFLSKNTLGLTFNIMTVKNKFDTDPLISLAVKSTGYVWKALECDWTSFHLNGGITLYQDVGKLKILERATLGYMSLKSPYVYIYIDNYNWIKQESVSTSSICIGFGGSLVYKIINDVGISLDVDYYTANFIFPEIYTYSSNKTSSVIKDVKQPYSSLFVKAGLCYYF
jgi:hypothetical protein